ncbi:MAG: MBL fold metallo-hydrolase, partial [Ruthenibacterium sp.]
GHFDHMGGNGQFEAAYMHPKTQELRNALHEKSYIEKFAAKVFKDSYFTGQAYATAYAYRDDFVALPVEQGFVFDLGGRTLEVIETPGHTRGCISLLDSKNKLLFDGDVLVSTPTLIFDWYSPEIEVYRETLEKLWELRTSYDLIFPGHFIKPIGQIYLRDMRICIDNLLRHEAQGVPVDLSHIAQEKALAYQYGKARVYYSLKKL